MATTIAIQEFDRQVEVLIQKGYPQLATMTTEVFRQRIDPLRSQVEELTPSVSDFDTGRLPFVIVIQHEMASTHDMMAQVERNGKHGITKLFPREPEDFSPINTVRIPQKSAYLLVDIDRGQANINIPPNEAMKLILKAERSPLTIEEGVAIVTQYPDFLMKNNCFSLLASRHSEDKRVPAIWINGKKHPNLGWCWDGNPHTWLGSASCVQPVS